MIVENKIKKTNLSDRTSSILADWQDSIDIFFTYPAELCPVILR